jgi:hypothetical protein
MEVVAGWNEPCCVRAGHDLEKYRGCHSVGRFGVETHGAAGIRYEPETYKNVVGYWTEVDDWVEWEFDSSIDGAVEVQIHCGCGTGNGGSDVDVIVEADGIAPADIAMESSATHRAFSKTL